MMKRIRRIFPQAIGTAGDVLRFYIGARQSQNAPTSWTGPYNFTIGTDYKIDVRVTARILDMRFEYTGTNTFRVHGMAFEYDNDGYR
jgi:hypothetical protein